MSCVHLAVIGGVTEPRPGRYNRGLDQFASDQVWPAPYLALAPEVCLGEIVRHITPDLLPQLNDYRS